MGDVFFLVLACKNSIGLIYLFKGKNPTSAFGIIFFDLTNFPSNPCKLH